MLGISVIVVSFVVAVLGMLQSHAAKPGEAAAWGLTKLGLILLIVSLIGLLFGVAKELQTLRAGADAKEWQGRTSQELKLILARLRGTQTSVGDPAIAAELGMLADQISATASRSRESNFSMSDFGMSDFADSNFHGGNFSRADFQGAVFRNAYLGDGDFSRASFEGALFPEADLRGADMSTALIDDKTKLPTRDETIE